MKSTRKSPQKGARHPLLMYWRTMDRLWKYTLVLGLVFAAVYRWSLIQETLILGISSNVWIFCVAGLALLFSVLSFFARYFAYVQAGKSFLKIATPFLQMRISYRRMQNVHPVLIQQLFPPQESSWALRSYLEPLYGKTALVVELQGLPLNPTFLRLFLPSAMFSPRSCGLVILVPDWMKLSIEMDSYHGAWLQNESARARASQAHR